MIDNAELARSLRYLVHEWSDTTLAVICDELATELQARGLASYVGVELVARQLRDHRGRHPRRADPAGPVAAPAAPIHGDDCGTRPDPTPPWAPAPPRL